MQDRIRKAIKNKQLYSLLSVLLVCILGAGVIGLSISLSNKIALNVQDNAYDSLMNTTSIIRRSLDSKMESDIEQLQNFAAMVGGNNEQFNALASRYTKQKNLQHIYMVDASGNGVSETGAPFHISDLPVAETALSGNTTISEGYYGDSGQIQLCIQTPILNNDVIVGAVYEEVIGTRYYSPELFYFLDGKGRASLFNREDGYYIIKPPRFFQHAQASDNMYNAIESYSENEGLLDVFRNKVMAAEDAIIQLQYEKSDYYVALSPSEANQNLCIATFIKKEDLQQEVNSVRQLLLLLQIVLFAGLGILLAIAIWRSYSIIKTKQKRIIDQEREKHFEELQKAHEALKLALDSAEQANLAKTHFLSNMSHDIRTPMNAVIGMTTVANDSIHDEEKVKECLRVIMSSSNHLLNLINDILDMSKIESGKMTLSSEPFALPIAVDNITAIIQPLCTAKEQTFQVELVGITHEFVIGDKTRLSQVIINLLNNANKYTPTGGKVVLRIEEKHKQISGHATYHIEVIDNGIGISKERLPYVFDAFVRETDSHVNKIEGTGLGLAIARNIVQNMGGALTVESELGVGTRFIADISLEINTSEDVPSDYKELKGIKALVIDDEYDVCIQTCEFLNEAGMITDWASSGQQAVVKVVNAHDTKEDYYVILVDWKMPDMDGVETIRLLRKIVGPDIPIIIVTAYEWEEIETTARNAGADAFISKPLFRSSLYEKLVEIKEQYSLVDKKPVDLSGLKILLVDDHPVNQMVAQRLFEGKNAAVQIASNGKEAVDLFEASKPGDIDVIFMDIQMPIMDGYKASKAIRTSSHPCAATIPIIAMTANVFTEDITAALAAGMNAHIAKPIDLTTVIQTLEDVRKSSEQ